MIESLYLKHSSASPDRLAEALRCRHCGRVDPRCGATLEMVRPQGTLEIYACVMASDCSPVTFLVPKSRLSATVGMP